MMTLVQASNAFDITVGAEALTLNGLGVGGADGKCAEQREGK